MGSSWITEREVGALLVVNDHRVRNAMTELLSAAAGFRLIAAVADPAEALRLAEHETPDVGIVDLPLSGEDRGLGLVAALGKYRTRVLALSAQDSLGVLALKAGAVAFIDKGSDPDRVLEAVRAVSSATDEDLVAGVWNTDTDLETDPA